VEQVRITITVEGDEQAGKVLDVLGEGEAEGKLDFAFEVRTDRDEPLQWLYKLPSLEDSLTS
jgi:hypothetical protein